MRETIIVELNTGESMTVWGLKITFKGGATLNYSNRPQAGAILLLLEYQGQVDEPWCMERSWKEPERAWGFIYTVLNDPECSPKKVRLEVQNIEG